MVNPQNVDTPLCVSVRRAGELLAIKPTLTWKLIKTGRLKAARIGQKRVVVPLSSILELLEQGVREAQG